jgi:tetratricopeptide (TPR) repeat protein
MEEASQNSEKNWLIRSSTRILGPYTLEEVTQMLVTKQISIIDEIRQPAVRWSYIRENKTFLDLVKNLRQEQDSSVENTMTSTSTVTTQTFTKTDAVTNMDELTPTPIIRPDSALRQQSGMKDITATAEVTSSRALGKSGGKSYGIQHDAQAQARLEKSTRQMKYVITGIALVILAAVSWSFLRRGQESISDYDLLSGQALRYKNIGLYEKALDAYKKIQNRREPDAELQFQMAPLLISEDRQSLLGRRILEKATLAEGRSRMDLLGADVGIALTYMQEGDLKEAENYLQKAMTYEPNNYEAQADLAIIQLKKGNYAVAARDLDSLARKNPRSVLMQGLRSLAWIEASRSEPNSDQLRSLRQDILATIEKTSYLRQELSLLLIRVNELLHDSGAEQESLKSFIAQVPFRSSQFQKNPMIDWRMLQWDYLEKYCAESLSGSLTSVQKMARAICLMEVNRDEDANRLITEALSESPRNPAFISVQAAYLMKVRRGSEAMALLKIPEVSAQPLARQLTGSLCMMQNNLGCAKQAFQSIHHVDGNDVYALYGLAWVALQESKKSEAYEFAKAGLQADPTYVPLIDLRDRLESQ